MSVRKHFIALCIILGLLTSLDIHAQSKVIVFVKPFQTVGVDQTFANSVTQLLRQKLAQTNRFGNVSEEAWRTQMELEGFYVQNIALFREDEDTKIAKALKARAIVYGRMERSGASINLSLNCWGVSEGYNIVPFWDELKNEDMKEAESKLNDFVSQMLSYMAPKGEVSSILNKEAIRIKIKSHPEEWNSGLVFDLKKADGTVYGKVRIRTSDGEYALGEVFDTKTDVAKGDLVEMGVQSFDEQKAEKPNVGLLAFEGNLLGTTRDDIYLRCQSAINSSGRVNLFDDQTVRDVMFGKSSVKLDYLIDGEITGSDKEGFSVIIRLKEFADEKLVQAEYEKCSPEMLYETIDVLLGLLLQNIPLRGQITKIAEDEIWVGLGEKEHIHKGQRFLIKSKVNAMTLCEAKVKKVYYDYFTCKRDKKVYSAQLGDFAEMLKDSKKIKKLNKRRENIKKKFYSWVKRNINAASTALTQATKDSLDRIRQQQERMAPKSRLKFSLSKIDWEQEYYENMFGGKKTTKFMAGLYLGNHPNFHIALNYQYAYFEDNTRPKGSKGNSYISSQSYGLGARIQFQIPFLFSTRFMPYVEGFGQFGNFSPTIKDNSRIEIDENKWTAYYILADAGIEFVFDRKFSFFGQIGATRKLKSPEEKPKFEFLSIDAGVAIWF